MWEEEGNLQWHGVVTDLEETFYITTQWMDTLISPSWKSQTILKAGPCDHLLSYDI